MRREVFIHIHIPKCGGTTFFSMLHANFGESYYRDQGLLNEYQYSSIQIDTMIKSYPWLKCYSSHKLSMDLPFNHDEKIIAMTFVRNPIAWLTSLYFYFHQSPSNFYNNPSSFCNISSNNNLHEYIKWSLINNQYNNNRQCHYLSGSREREGFERIIKLVDEGKLLLFPIERYNEVCVILENLFPSYFKNCASVYKNVSKKKQNISEKDKQTIIQYSGYDLQLVQKANDFLDVLISKCFPHKIQFNNAMKNYELRCLKKKRLKSLVSVLLPAYRRLKKLKSLI